MNSPLAAPSGVMERTLATLELLAAEVNGLSLGEIADRLAMPRSATHRLLSDLVRCGYVQQPYAHGDYRLTPRLATIGAEYQRRCPDLAR
jgi:IclR family transcriptional regulator, acetate operon repressor